MPSSQPRKRTIPSAESESDEQRPSKLPRYDDFEQTTKTALEEILKSLQDEKTLSDLAKLLRDDPKSANKIDDFYKIIQKAKRAAAPPIDFKRSADISYLFQSTKRLCGRLCYHYCGDYIRIKVGDAILAIIEIEIMAKVNQDVCTETKLNALEALMKIAHRIVDNGWSHGAVPEALILGLIKLGEMLTFSEIQLVCNRDHDIRRRLKELRDYRRLHGYKGKHEWIRLTDFLGFFVYALAGRRRHGDVRDTI